MLDFKEFDKYLEKDKSNFHLEKLSKLNFYDSILYDSKEYINITSNLDEFNSYELLRIDINEIDDYTPVYVAKNKNFTEINITPFQLLNSKENYSIKVLFLNCNIQVLQICDNFFPVVNYIDIKFESSELRKIIYNPDKFDPNSKINLCFEKSLILCYEIYREDKGLKDTIYLAFSDAPTINYLYLEKGKYHIKGANIGLLHLKQSDDTDIQFKSVNILNFYKMIKSYTPLNLFQRLSYFIVNPNCLKFNKLYENINLIASWDEIASTYKKMSEYKYFNNAKAIIDITYGFFECRDSIIRRLLFLFHKNYTSLLLPLLVSIFCIISGESKYMFNPIKGYSEYIFYDISFTMPVDWLKVLNGILITIFLYSSFCLGVAIKKKFGIKKLGYWN